MLAMTTRPTLTDLVLTRYLDIWDEVGGPHRNSAPFHAQLTMLRLALELAEKAMTDEGVPARARQRVITTMVFGTPDIDEGVRGLRKLVAVQSRAERLDAAFAEGFLESRPPQS